jgi:hypothetical protein
MYPDGRTVKLELLPNPSHLEAVNPLVVGKARAKVWKNVFIYFISKFALVLFFFVDFGGFVVLWTNM